MVISCYVVESYAHDTARSKHGRDHECVSQQSEQSFLAHVASHRRRSSPPSFRSLLPPDFIYRSLQGALHRSLAKSRDVIIRWGDVLRQISKLAASAGLEPRRRLTISHSGFTVVTVRM